LLVEAPPDGEEWLHEPKYDGYRIGVRIERGKVELWSRRAREWTDDFPTVVRAAAALRLGSALIDGELAAVLPNGATSFQALQNRTPKTPLAFFAFDLLHLGGEDLRALPLEERKARLATLLRGTAGVIRYADHVVARGPAVFAEACRLGLEGIVSKRLGSRYRPGRNTDWQKTKCVRRQELVIGGFTEPEGSREAIGALLVGTYEDGQLRWAGKVGTGPGWTGRYLRELRRRLDALATSRSPFHPPVDDSWLRRNARWVRPQLVAEVAFVEWTDDGRVRHASMQGLREDKDPREVRRERAIASAVLAPQKRKVPSPERPLVAGIGISHPERIVYSDVGVTKLDVARYYDRVASWMVPHVMGRPLTLLRCARAVDPAEDKGGCVMMRHGRAWGPSALRRVSIRERTKTGEYLVADDGQGLVALAQMDVLEIHTWNARAEAPYSHDRIVVDLDPGPAVRWADVVAAAKLVRRMFDDLKLACWVKTTGGKGLHVVAPIAPAPVDECLAFARAIAGALVQHDPSRYTTTLAKAGRERQILVDALRNNRTNTSVAAYSLRARAGAPVSVPLDWDELTARLTPTDFDIRSVGLRLRDVGDPWRSYPSARQRLPADKP
jgi:bifunctional non-homologous end joining protein LigD